MTPITHIIPQTNSKPLSQQYSEMPLPWKRLIRFVATDGRTLHSALILPTSTTDLGFVTESDRLQARMIEGEDIYGTTGGTRCSVFA